MSQWVADTGYVGWFDVDLVYDLKTDRVVCFETMVRFAIPSIACILKLGNCDWLTIFERISNGGSVTQADFLWKHPWSIGVGLFSFSITPNCISGDLPTEAPIVDYEDFWKVHPCDSNEHLIGMEVFDCSNCEVLELAGSTGRHLYAVGTGNTWREAMRNAYNVCETVSFPNKVYKQNLFGYTAPVMCDSNLDELLPRLVEKGVLLCPVPKF
jgi:phosphoribosylamine-glycine ligase